MNAVTNARAAGLFCGTATAVVELRNASSSTREPGRPPTSPPTDSRDSAIASSLPAFIMSTASSGFLTFTVVAFGDAATEARPVAVPSTIAMRTPARLASASVLIVEPGATRYVLCNR